MLLGQHNTSCKPSQWCNIASVASLLSTVSPHHYCTTCQSDGSCSSCKLMVTNKEEGAPVICIKPGNGFRLCSMYTVPYLATFAEGLGPQIFHQAYHNESVCHPGIGLQSRWVVLLPQSLVSSTRHRPAQLKHGHKHLISQVEPQ